MYLHNIFLFSTTETLIVLDSAKNKDRFRIREGVAVKRRRIEAEDKAIQEAREKLERDNPRNFEYFFRKMAHRASGQLRENLLIRGNDLDENVSSRFQIGALTSIVTDEVTIGRGQWIGMEVYNLLNLLEDF